MNLYNDLNDGNPNYWDSTPDSTKGRTLNPSLKVRHFLGGGHICHIQRRVHLVRFYPPSRSSFPSRFAHFSLGFGPCLSIPLPTHYSATIHSNLRRQTPPYPSLCRPHPPSPAAPVRGAIAAAFACYLPALFALFSFGIGPPSPSPHHCQALTGELHGDIVVPPNILSSQSSALSPLFHVAINALACRY